MWRAALILAIAAGAAIGGGCGGSGGGPATLTVYVSAPLHGPRATEGLAIVAGARQALGQAGGRVGDLRIRAVYLDDTGDRGTWSPVATAANARRAAEDSSTIGYIGEVDSGATRFSLPITNQADIVQISPASTAVDLTRSVGEVDPDRYRPSEDQTFARIVPPDDVQAQVAAELAKLHGARSVATSPDGLAEVPEQCRSRSPLYLTSPFRDPSRLSAQVDARVRGRPGEPIPATAYGFEAMSLLLDAIGRADEGGDDRGSVVDEVLATSDRSSIIGDYSIDGNGDTTLDLISVYTVRDCRPTFTREQRPG